jgi:flagellar basal-body rod protein FlgC
MPSLTSAISACASVLATEPAGAFDAALGRASATGVRVADIVEDQTPFRRRYQPSHPDADANGFVALPNVDPAEEMVDMMSSARAYQANLAAIGLVRDLVARSLELGK